MAGGTTVWGATADDCDGVAATTGGSRNGSQWLTLHQAILLLDQTEERACRRFLAGQELLMQACGLFLQILQSLHALPGDLQCLLQGAGRGIRHRGDDRLGRGRFSFGRRLHCGSRRSHLRL